MIEKSFEENTRGLRKALRQTSLVFQPFNTVDKLAFELKAISPCSIPLRAFTPEIFSMECLGKMTPCVIKVGCKPGLEFSIFASSQNKTPNELNA